MISIIGIGGAGGNIADLWAKLGHSAGAINFSQKDLDSLEHVTNRLRIPGSEGVGKDRNTAIELIKLNYEMVLKFIQDNFSHNDVIALVFSSSGGSGSGISPLLLEILSSIMPEKTFIALVVIPDESEVTMNQINCVSTFEELSKLDVAIFPIDNAQVRKRTDVIGKNKLFEVANAEVVNRLNELIEYTNMSSKNGNFDKKDFLTTLNTKGIGLISSVRFSTHNIGDKLTSEIHKSWDHSVFVPANMKYVTRAGVIFDGKEDFLKMLRYDQIFNVFEGGMPIDLFEGNYHDSKDIGKVTTILTGLAWIDERLKQVEQIIQNSESKIELISNASNEYKSSVSGLYGKLRNTEQKKESVTDILAKWKK